MFAPADPQRPDPGGGLATAADIPLDTALYSALLQQLYAAAREGDMVRFQPRAMAMLRTQLPFDGAWWGRSTLDGANHTVHCSYLYNLPADVPLQLNAHDPHNLVGERTTAHPGRVLQFDHDDLTSRPGTAALTAHMGIRQALCISVLEQDGGTVSFVSVTRDASTPRFTALECRVLALWMPHLAAALDLCCVMQMTRSRYGDHRAMVTTDLHGWLHVQEPGAVELLQREWPGRIGCRLPWPLVDRIAARGSVFLGRHLHVDIRWHGEHVLLRLRPREPNDLLSPQERAVSDAFSCGQSYKAVARGLAMAPATVRHHLRSVYRKLGVSDKAALARLLTADGRALDGSGA